MSFRAVIQRWPSRLVLAQDLSVPKVNVNMWFRRDYIPDYYWSKLIVLARRRHIKLTLVELADLRANQP